MNTGRRKKAPKVLPGDYYVEGDCVVFTEKYHLKRGYCCLASCRHCPWHKERSNREDSGDTIPAGECDRGCESECRSD